ncbi:DUF4397 domain-containing protein [Candidatus Gracilibacteria bacterium]|nr:DUF4397 domain-containing protein [Candidatus Gracilibacteria bacterium]
MSTQVLDLTYTEFSNYLPLEAGSYFVEVIPSGASEAAISGTLELVANQDYTVAAIGNVVNQPLEFLVLEDDNTPLTDTAKLRIVHTAPFSNTLDGTRVDVRFQDGTQVPGLSNIPYKAFSPYLELPAGTYDLKVTAPSQPDVVIIDPAPVTLVAGDVTTVFAIGDGINFAPTVLLEPALNNVRLKVAHLAPFASEIISTSVTIRVNGTDVLTDVVFQDISDYLPLAAGDYFVEVIPTGASEAAISGTVTLEAGQDYTAAAIGNVINQPLEFLLLEDDNTPVTDTAKLRIVHTAPFSNTLDGTRVDVRFDDGGLVPGLGNVPYKAISPYLELPAGIYNLKVTAPGDADTLYFDVPPVRLENGDIVTVFAIGDGENQDLGVLIDSATAIELGFPLYLPIIRQATEQ